MLRRPLATGQSGWVNGFARKTDAEAVAALRHWNDAIAAAIAPDNFAPVLRRIVFISETALGPRDSRHLKRRNQQSALAETASAF
jgi:hypothetical protein